MRNLHKNIQKSLYLLQITAYCFAMYHFLTGNYFLAIQLLIETLFLEKFVVFLLNSTSNFMLASQEKLRETDFKFLELVNDIGIRKRNELSSGQRMNIAQGCKKLSYTIKKNYSPLTQVPEGLQAITPQSIKIFLKEFIGPLTPMEYFIQRLLNKQIRQDIDINLGKISDKKANALINVLERKDCPSIKSPNFVKSLNFVGYPGIFVKAHKIEQLIYRNNIRNAAIECVTLQQGKRSKQSLVYLLPQELLEKVYGNVFPYTNEEIKQKQFVKNVANSAYSLFHHKNVSVNKTDGFKFIPT